MVYPAKIEKLDDFLCYIENELGNNGVPIKITMSFLVSAEEIFVNIANYAYKDGDGDIEVDFEVKDNLIKITFSDSGIPFNPLEKEDPDINASVDERDIGGLGIYMVKKAMDGICYDYIDNKNVLSFWKSF